MALFEVTIAGSCIMFEEDCETAHCLEEAVYTFVKEGRDLIETMMSVQAKLDLLNDGLKQKYPKVFRDDVDWAFRVVGICKTDLIRFNDAWIKDYVEQGIVSRNYDDDDN